jgi:hypothetical protein
MSDAVSRDLERQILDTHDRFTRVIGARLATMDLAQKERYFVLVSTLVGKLEDLGRPMKQVLQEMVNEMLPLVLDELSQP